MRSICPTQGIEFFLFTIAFLTAQVANLADDLVNAVFTNDCSHIKQQSV